MSTTAPASSYRWVILALAFGGQVSNSLASLSVAPLAPLFQPELGLSNAEVGMFSSATFVGAWGILLAAGWLADRFGVRKIISTGEIAAGALMLGMAAVSTFWQAAAVMLVVGIGRGMVSPAGAKAVMEWFPPTSRATAMGIKQTGVPFGGILTASILPALALTVGWRLAMGAVGILLLGAGVVTAILYREMPGATRAMGRKGQTEVGLGSVLGNHQLWSLSGIALLYVTVQFGLTTYLVLYFKEVVLAASVPDESTRILVAGGYLALCQAGGVFGRIFWSVLSDRPFRGLRMPLMAGIGVLTALLSLAFAALGMGCPVWLLAPVVFGYGATAMGWNGVFHSAVCEETGPRLAASAIGLTFTLSQVGLVAGPPLFGLLVDVTGSYHPSWLPLAILAAVGAVASGLCARGEKGPESWHGAGTSRCAIP